MSEGAPLDKKQIEALVELALRRQAEDDFYTFVKLAWHIVEPGAKFQGGWALKAICEHLEAVYHGQIKRLLINQPPRTGKSSLISVLWPVWVWTKNPAEQFMCISYAESLAKRDNVKARRLIKSKWFTVRYPDIVLAEDQDTKNYIENTKGGHRYVTGVDGSVTGFGANIIICDDLNSVRDNSETMLESAQSFFTEVLPTRFNDFKTGRMVVVQQRTDTRDISGWILANQKDQWVCLILPMEFESSRRCVTVPLKSTNGIPWQDPRTEEGELLWPERFGERELKLLKSALSSEYACTPYEAPILMGDLSLKPIGEVRIGDDIIGWSFNDKPIEESSKTTKIIDIFTSIKPIIKVTLDSGEIIRCTPDHQWYVRWKRDRKNQAYLPAAIGHGLCRVCPPRLPNGALGGKFIRGHEKVVSIEPDGEDVVYSLKTETGNYVVWGLASKNCAGQLQQRPAPMEGGMIKRAWWQPWKQEGAPNIRFIIQAWDTAMSMKEQAAFSACLTFGVFKDDNNHDSLILLGAWRKRVEFPDLYKAVQRMGRDYRATEEDSQINERYKPDLILVEEKASGIQLIQTLNKAGLVLVGWRPDKYGDKIERVRRVTHILEAGRVYVPYRAPDFTKPKKYADFLINQCAMWPKGDGHDLVDCLSMVLQRVINSGWVLHPMEHSASQEDEWRKEYIGQEDRGFY